MTELEADGMSGIGAWKEVLGSVAPAEEGAAADKCSDI